jgi:hypothetical protein
MTIKNIFFGIAMLGIFSYKYNINFNQFRLQK